MFLGTTPGPVRDYLASELRRVKPDRVIEPCAGNFVLSITCGAVDKDIKVLSGDVSLYSMAIGCAFAGKDIGIRLKPEMVDQYPFFRGKESPEEIATSVILWAELADYLRKKGVRYYEALVNDMTTNMEGYYSAVLKKVRAAKALLGKNYEFVAQDAAVTLEGAGEGDFVLFDPPYFLGGYEKMFEALDQCFDYPSIPFTEFTDERKMTMLQEIAARGCKVIWRPEDLEVIPEGFQVQYQYQYKAEGNNYYLLTNYGGTPAQGRRIFMRSRQPKWDVIYGKDLKEDSTVEMIKIRTAEANHYRSMWTKKAIPREMGTQWLLVVGGLVCGIVSVNSGSQFGIHFALIVSDVAALHTPYRRLGKLVLHAILTEEFLLQVNEEFLWEHTGFTTVAYSDAPVSMKYRGLFNLIERRPGAGGKKYALAYRVDKPKWKTLREAYQSWWKKHKDDLDPS